MEASAFYNYGKLGGSEESAQIRETAHALVSRWHERQHPTELRHFDREAAALRAMARIYAVA